MSSSPEISTSDGAIRALNGERDLSTDFMTAVRAVVEDLYRQHKRDLARLLPQGAADELRETRKTNVRRIATIMGADKKVQQNERTGEPTMKSICEALGAIFQTTKGFEPLNAIFWTGLRYCNTHLSGEKKDYWPPLKELLSETIEECDEDAIKEALRDTLDLIEPTCFDPITKERVEQIWLEPRYSSQLDRLLAQGVVTLTSSHEATTDERSEYVEPPALIPEVLPPTRAPEDSGLSLNELKMPVPPLVLRLGSGADLYINPLPDQEVSIKPDGNGGVTIKLAGKK